MPATTCKVTGQAQERQVQACTTILHAHAMQCLQQKVDACRMTASSLDATSEVINSTATLLTVQLLGDGTAEVLT